MPAPRTITQVRAIAKPHLARRRFDRVPRTSILVVGSGRNTLGRHGCPEFSRMTLLAAPAAALAWLGRQGTRAIAALVFIAIAVQPVDTLLKLVVTQAIFVLPTLAFPRCASAQVRGHLGRRGL